MRWTTSTPTEDPLVNTNTWFLGKAIHTLRTLGNQNHIWEMLTSSYKHTS